MIYLLTILTDFLFGIPHPSFQNTLFNKSEILFIVTRSCSFSGWVFKMRKLLEKPLSLSLFMDEKRNTKKRHWCRVLQRHLLAEHSTVRATRTKFYVRINLVLSSKLFASYQIWVMNCVGVDHAWPCQKHAISLNQTVANFMTMWSCGFLHQGIQGRVGVMFATLHFVAGCGLWKQSFSSAGWSRRKCVWPPDIWLLVMNDSRNDALWGTWARWNKITHLELKRHHVKAI